MDYKLCANIVYRNFACIKKEYTAKLCNRDNGNDSLSVLWRWTWIRNGRESDWISNIEIIYGVPCVGLANIIIYPYSILCNIIILCIYKTYVYKFLIKTLFFFQVWKIVILCITVRHNIEVKSIKGTQYYIFYSLYTLFNR